MDEETKMELSINAGVFFLAHLSDLQIASIAAVFSMFHRPFTRCFKKVVEKEDEQCRAGALGELVHHTLMEARDWGQRIEKEGWEDKEND